jgi:hypothetical protein
VFLIRVTVKHHKNFWTLKKFCTPLFWTFGLLDLSPKLFKTLGFSIVTLITLGRILYFGCSSEPPKISASSKFLSFQKFLDFE